jgi:hypothetical protein
MSTWAVSTAERRRPDIRRILVIGLLLAFTLLAGCESGQPSTPVTKQGATTATTQATTSTTSHPPTTTTTAPSTT